MSETNLVLKIEDTFKDETRWPRHVLSKVVVGLIMIEDNLDN